MPKGNILIVDDNKSIISTLEILLGPEFDEVKGITNPNLIVITSYSIHYTKLYEFVIYVGEN